ncbi:MAG: antitoxin [bacterium]|jgi:predicted DNA binding CopG/RHH family protein
MKKMTKLGKEEMQLLKEVENDEWVDIPNMEKEKERYKKLARSFALKKKNINIRLAENDLLKLKSKSLSTGLSYQTLVAFLIHQYVSGKININV